MSHRSSRSTTMRRVTACRHRMLPPEAPVPSVDPVVESPVAAEPSPKRPPFAQRLRKFATSPMQEKYAILAHRFHRSFPHVPVPCHLAFGAWLLVENSSVDSGLLWGYFEAAELRFVERFLEPGMSV